MGKPHNKAFKSDSQRLAVSLRSSIAKRRSHLNAALGAVKKFLNLISSFSLAIRASFSAIWLYHLKFLNHLARKTCQCSRVASLDFRGGWL
ncbi:hypothetical protein CGG82_24515 [Vibrio parahaemolyticus]|nr:hypothetical protein [Vibrio parahaemolyticus]TOR06142.1 hypothetical protein CGG82_24515 [Vibrio parahaemolyticus]